MDPIITLIIGIILGTLIAIILSFLTTRNQFDKLKSSSDTLKLRNASLEEKFALSENLRFDAESSRDTAREKSTQLEIRSATLSTQLHEQLNLIEQQKNMEETLKDAIKNISTEAIESNSKTFIERATNDLIKPMSNQLTTNLEKLETNLTKLNNMEKQYISTTAHIKQFQEINLEMRRETEKLSSALRGTAQAPGRYGEITLERIAELAGMVEHCDFNQQYTITSTEGKIERPDMIVNMPSKRQIIVDAKTSIQAYLNAIDASSEDEKQVFLKQHARQLKDRVNELSRKAYWEALEFTPEFVIMFVPGDHFLQAALKEDHNLIDAAMQAKVLITTPTSLVGLLKIIALGWQEQQLSEQAREIRDAGRIVHDRIESWARHLDDMGKGLQRAVKSYDDAMGSLDRMVLSGVRRFKEMGISTDKTIPEIHLLQSSLRELPESLRTTSENEHEDAI